MNGPRVSSITPGGGAPGTAVTIDGSGFTQDALVLFGTVPATQVVYRSSGELVARAPGQPAGTVDVTVTTPKGTSPTNAATKYVYPAVVWTSLNGSNQVLALTVGVGTITTLNVDPGPQGIAVTPDGARVVVATSAGATVIDTATRTVQAKFAFAGADDVAVAPNSHFAYVTTPKALQVLDLTGPTPIVDAPIPLPGATKLHDVAVTSDGAHALVTDPTGNKVWNVSVPGGFVPPPFTFTSPEAITVHGDTAWLTTKTGPTGALVELQASTLAPLGSEPFDGDPMAVATTPAGDYVYVALTAAGKLLAFHHTAPGTAALAGTTALTGKSPLGLVLLPNGGAGFTALNATTAPPQLEVFVSPPPGAAPVTIKGKNPFDVAVATPSPIACGPSGVTPLTITPSVSKWPTHDDFGVVTTLGSCGDSNGSPITAHFREVFTAPKNCAAPHPGIVTATLSFGANAVPAQFVAVHCAGNWAVKVTVFNTANNAVIATGTNGFVVG